MLIPDDAAPGAVETPAAPVPMVDADPIVDWDDVGEDETPQPPAAPAPVPAAPGVPPAQPAAPTAAQPPIAAAPSSEAVPPGSPLGTPPAAPPAAPAAPSVWEFQGDGRTLFVEGSTKNVDGSLAIPADQVPHLESLLAEGAAHRGSWRGEKEQYEGRIAQLEDQVANKANDPEIVRARAYNEQLLALIAKGPDAVAEWLDNYERNFPVFQARAQEAVLRQQLSERDARLSAIDEERSAAELTPQIEARIGGVVERMAAQYPTLNAEQLHRRIVTRHLDQVAYEVDPKERSRGLAAGEVLLGRGPKGELWIVNEGLIEEEFAYQASLMGGAASAAQAAVAHNRAISAPPSAVAPAVPASAAIPVGAGAAKMPEFPNTPEGKQQMQDWIDSGEWRKSVFPSTR